MAVSPILHSRVSVNDDVMFQELDGEGVLLNLKTGVYFGLDSTGARIWRLLETHGVVSEIRDALVKEYDVPEERCTQDLVTLIADMKQHGLVTLS